MLVVGSNSSEGWVVLRLNAQLLVIQFSLLFIFTGKRFLKKRQFLKVLFAESIERKV